MENGGFEVVRKPISVTLPPEVVDWVDKQVDARTYHNRSHAIEVIILKEMKGEQ